MGKLGEDRVVDQETGRRATREGQIEEIDWKTLVCPLSMAADKPRLCFGDQCGGFTHHPKIENKTCEIMSSLVALKRLYKVADAAVMFERVSFVKLKDRELWEVKRENLIPKKRKQSTEDPL